MPLRAVNTSIMPSVPALRGGDVDLVARRIGQRPPRRRELVAHHVPAGGERRRDPDLGLLVRHPDRDVDRTAAVLARLVHLLEPERDTAKVRIDEVFGGTVATRLVAEHGLPERHHPGSIGRAWDDEQALDHRWVGSEAQLSGGSRDPAGQHQIALAHPAVVVGEGDQAHGHALMPHVDVGLVVVDARQLADRLYEPGALGERTGPEERVRAIADDAPILDALGLTELLRADVVGHESSLCARDESQRRRPRLRGEDGLYDAGRVAAVLLAVRAIDLVGGGGVSLLERHALLDTAGLDTAVVAHLRATEPP